MIKFQLSHQRSVSDGIWKAAPLLHLPTQLSQWPPQQEMDKTKLQLPPYPSLLHKVATPLVEEKQTGSQQTLNVCHFLHVHLLLYIFITASMVV